MSVRFGRSNVGGKACAKARSSSHCPREPRGSPRRWAGRPAAETSSVRGGQPSPLPVPGPGPRADLMGAPTHHRRADGMGHSGKTGLPVDLDDPVSGHRLPVRCRLRFRDQTFPADTPRPHPGGRRCLVRLLVAVTNPAETSLDGVVLDPIGRRAVRRRTGLLVAGLLTRCESRHPIGATAHRHERARTAALVRCLRRPRTYGPANTSGPPRLSGRERAVLRAVGHAKLAAG